MTGTLYAVGVAAAVPLFAWLLTRRRRRVARRPLDGVDVLLIAWVTAAAAALWPIGWVPVVYLSFGRIHRRVVRS